MDKITDETLNIDILKEQFPSYKWNDASDRNHNEIHKIVSICWNIENVSIYIRKNEKNKIFFGEILMQEISKGLVVSNIDIIILNKDNYIYFCKGSDDIISDIKLYLDNLRM
tara:strand:+ start:298 stop:633 length:336 start_codon:yes stop_codon:yes gene_type:complete